MDLELDKFKDVNLVIDKANDIFIPKQFVSQGDYKGRTLTVQITNNGSIGEVPGLTLNLNWHNEASGLTDLTAFTILDKANSIFRIEYPENMMTPGKVYASIQIIQDGKVTNLKQFELIVQKLAGQPVGIVEKAEFSALVAALADSNKFRTDIDKKADKTYINDYLSQVTVVPETFANLAEIKAKYPSGKNGLMVAADNGHKYIWANNVWTDAGVYQSAGVADGSIVAAKIADNTITNHKIKSLSLRKITDGYSDLTVLNEKYLWGASGSTIGSSADTFTFNKQSGISGFQVPVAYPDEAALTRPLHVYFEIKKISADLKDPIAATNDIFLSDYHGNLLSPEKAVNTIITFSDNNDWDIIDFVIPASAFADHNISNDNMFFLTLLWHGGSGMISGRNWCINEDNEPNSVHYIQSKSVTANKLSNDISIRQFNANFVGKNKSAAGYDISYDNGLKFVKKEAGDKYIRFPIDVPLSDQQKDLYGSFEVLGESLGTIPWGVILSDKSGYIIWGSIKSGVVPSSVNYKRIQFKIPWKKLITSQSYNYFYLDIWTHGEINQWGIIKNLTVSSLPFSGDVSAAIEYSDYWDCDYELVGDKLDISANSESEKLIPDGITAFTNAAPVSQDGMILGKIEIYSDIENPVYQAVVAELDQYDLLVNETNITNFIGALHKGVNTFDLTKYNISINKNAYLIIKSNQLPLYNATGARIKALICDNTHEITSPYVGFSFYKSTLTAPLYYEVVEKSTLQKLQDKTLKLGQANEDLKAQINHPEIKLISPSGNPFRLTASDDGSISTISLMPHEVVLWGNSLLGETGSFGMAASDQYHDYYYLVSQKLKAMNPSVKIANRKSVYAWEAGIANDQTAMTISEKRLAWWNETGTGLIAESTDLVILQLVDNVNSDEREATLEVDAVTLIRNIRTKAPHARVLWVAGWFGAQSKIDKIRRACKTTGAEFVDITTHRDDADMKSSIGSVITRIDGTTWIVDSNGVAIHPSDKGMQYIADQIISAID